MKDIIRFLWQYRARIAIGLVALIAVDVTILVIPYFIKESIDQLARGQSDLIWQYSLMILAYSATGLIFRFLWRYFLVGAARRIERQLRARFYDHLLKLSAPYYTQTKTGDLMAHATNDMEAVMRACGFGVLTLADFILMTTATLILMMSINVELTFYVILPLPFVGMVVLGFGRVIHKRFQMVQEGFSILMEKVREALSGIRVVKSFVQETGMERDYSEANQKFIDTNMHLVKVWGMFDPSISFLSGLGTALLLWAGGTRVITSAITIGEFAQFTLYLTMLVWPMMALGFMVNVLQRGSASMNRLNKIFNTEPEIANPANPKPIPATANLEVRNLTFAYNKGVQVLQDINLKVENGKTLGIVGPVGSGKSTLINLIVRLFDPPKGTVFYGDLDVQELEMQALRDQVGMVPQDPFLFSDTLRENIRFGNPNANEEQIVRAVELAGMYDDIKGFPDGLDTIVGERGVSLSGGQKQRMGIARALLVDPKLLILDDCLSAVDAEKEEEILSNLENFLSARTSIIIAHRISAVQDADQIIVLDEEGKIADQGTHLELIAREGFYRHLYQMQQAQKQLSSETEKTLLS